MTDYTPTIFYICGIPAGAAYRGEVSDFKRVDAGKGRTCLVATFTDMAQVCHDAGHMIAVFDPCADQVPRYYICPERKRKQRFSGEGTCVPRTGSAPTVAA
jgi:hypothetical protein